MQYGALLCVLRITGPFLTGHIDHLNCTLWLRSLGEHVAFCRKEIILPVFDKRCQKEQKENIEGGGGGSRKLERVHLYKKFVCCKYKQ